MDLLARREHSCYELTNKLVQKGFEKDHVEVAVDALRCENLVSDERYVEAYVRSRASRGFGPLKIRLELAQRGVEGCQVQAHFNRLPDDYWLQAMQVAWDKKWHGQFDGTADMKAKCLRYLQYKGFEIAEIYQKMSENT